jgi:hypothetical protein
MAVKLIANYAKKLGLPGYSSHQFSISVETELVNVDDIAGTSEKLYKQLQNAVDEQMQNYGYVPPDGYGMAPESNGHNGNNANGHSRNGGNGSNAAWNCTEGQERLVKQLVHDHQLDKNEVEGMAQQLFGCGVIEMNKMQASQLIDDLLEKAGKKPAGGMVPVND